MSGKNFKTNGKNGKRDQSKETRSRGSSRNKRTEVNIPDSSINKEDLATIVKDGKVRAQNDPSWYAQNPQLLKDAASFPYSWPVGSPVDLDMQPVGKLEELVTYQKSIPGIMSFRFTPTIGYSADPTSPINIAARQIYSFVRHANSGHSNYDSPDLMMYLIAMDSAYMWLSYMTRVYGTAMLYSPVNRYLPKALLKAQNVDADDVFMNLAQLRFYINEFAYKIASMCVPAGMTYFTRHAWLSTNIYQDAPSSKAQLYLFSPETYYVFREQVQGPAYLTARGVHDEEDYLTNLKVSQLVEIGKEILEPIISSEDFNIMSGDILKAFGSDNLMKVAPISEDYTVMPVYVAEVNSQIENLVAVGSSVSTLFGTSFPTSPQESDITQSVDTGAIIQKYRSRSSFLFGGTSGSTYLYTLSSASYWNGMKKMNMHTDNVTPEMSMVASRLITAGKPIIDETTSTTWAFVDMTAYGSEVINSIHVYQIVDGEARLLPGIEDAALTNIVDIRAMNGMLLTTTYNPAILASLFAQFDWSPALRFFNQAGASTAVSGSYIGDTFDTDNFTLLDDVTLFRLHETALLSMFSVPQMAAISSKPINR